MNDPDNTPEIQQLIDNAVNEEIEACAELAERLDMSDNHEIAFAIRLRKKRQSCSR